MSLIPDARRVLLVHAHPDDETLATGALIADLVADGVEVHVVTATRGERGELMPDVADVEPGSPAYVALRERELAGALDALGVSTHSFLGMPPARDPGAVGSRSYRDSGMRWVRDGLAGPAADSGPESFTAAMMADAVADLSAAVTATDPDLLVTYDAGGGYGHPDHVRTHEVTTAVARAHGIPVIEVIPPDREVPGDASAVQWHDRSEHLPRVQEALRAHASQVRVEGADVVHVGGQREPIVTRVGLRVHRAADTEEAAGAEGDAGLPHLPDATWSRVLCVVAHPDDMEYGASAAVASWTRHGVEVSYLLLTSGEAGMQEPPEVVGPLRAAEQARACATVGVDHLVVLDHPDGMLEPSLALRRDIARVIRQVRPDAVVTANHDLEAYGGLNQADHRAAGLATIDAVRDADNTWVFRELADVEGLPKWHTRWILVAGHPQPTHARPVDADAVAAAVASLECHEAYLADLPGHPRPAELIPAILRGGGAATGVDNAVTFRAYDLGEGMRPAESQ